MSMPTPLAKSAFGISYTDSHYNMLPMYHFPMAVTQLPANSYDMLDEYQRFVTYANNQPGETVLDFACRTGFVGLLACDVLGAANARQVDFVDGSKPALHLRDPQAPALLKHNAGKPNGWNVVLAFLFLDQFTDDAKPLMIQRLRHFVALGGRLVFDWPVPGPSRGLWE
ncbi:hypothetical protein KC330_g8201 [Hortaea werneckii]|nr:hypothetical protein KC330_g8201 [Hortaea werneckii]